MHGKVSQCIVLAVIIRGSLTIGAPIWQGEIGGIVAETAGCADRFVPQAVGHHDVVAGTTSVGILRRVASTVGVLLPRRGGLEEFACPLHGRRQVRALVEVDILQPSIKLSFVLRRVGLEGIVPTVAVISIEAGAAPQPLPTDPYGGREVIEGQGGRGNGGKATVAIEGIPVGEVLLLVIFNEFEPITTFVVGRTVCRIGCVVNVIVPGYTFACPATRIATGTIAVRTISASPAIGTGSTA